ncbi:hypothetical protein Hypma_010778 [Hypsizygus marmoreus]|uniref:Uncharacterized protein n=1 Tax=Hypsizygus marmoreus TaxID=39966 RepID=A0A369JNZ5_HYPMA|nr:hypothetical protein Hypma_010778 [Hypsizygus marmoreus]
MSNQSEILNPLTPMAYLSPPEAHQITISGYIAVGLLAALVWDILTHLDLEYKILFRSKISIPIVVYFLARLTVLSSLFLVILSTDPLGKHCPRLGEVVCVFYHVTYSATTLLFFLRLRAIFHGNRPVIVVGFLLWLGSVGGALTSLITGGAGAVEIQPSNYCGLTPATTSVIAPPVTLAVFDTFVCFAISWRLLESVNNSKHSSSSLWKRILLGRDMPALSRVLLQDGQVYYLVSLTSSLATVLISFLPGIPMAFRYASAFNTIVVNAMACQVFRKTKYGMMTRAQPSTLSRGVLHENTEIGPEATSSSHEVQEGGQKRTWRAKALGAVMILVPFSCMAICFPRAFK